MRELLVRPEIYEFDTFSQFAKGVELGEKDLILTNAYIYEPLNMVLRCQVIYQENFGGGEPTDEMVQAIINEARKFKYDRVIAVGGGTVIDIAKIIALDSSDDIYEIYDNAENLSRSKQLIIVPTTCGTGSEVTNLSIVNLQKIGVKKGLACGCMYADSAILIPEFIETLPYEVFATSSIDALIHAIESFLNPKATNYSDLFAKEAIRMIVKGYLDINKNGRASYCKYGADFLRASNYAGIAFSNSGCATIHAMSYAFGGKYHVAHGESNYQFLSSVLAFYREKKPNGKIFELEKVLGEVLPHGNAVDELDKLLEQILPKKKMSEYGAVQADVSSFAKLTFENQQRLLLGSYVPMSQDDLRELFEQRL